VNAREPAPRIRATVRDHAGTLKGGLLVDQVRFFAAGEVEGALGVSAEQLVKLKVVPERRAAPAAAASVGAAAAAAGQLAAAPAVAAAEVAAEAVAADGAAADAPEAAAPAQAPCTLM
jgi:hypothetical protein